jgi:hypothetical protein
MDSQLFIATVALLFKVLVTSACIHSAAASADHLSERNLPPGKLIYTNGTDYYYAVVTTHQLQNPNERWVKDHDIQFRVIAFRKARSDGSLVQLIKQQVTDRFGKQVEGYRYHPQETALVNEHLIAVIDRLFPDREHGNYLTMLFYSIDEHFSNGDSNSSDVDSPEMYVTQLMFGRPATGQSMKPAYEGRGLTGSPASGLKRGTQDLPAARVPLSADVIAMRIQSQKQRASTMPEELVGLNMVGKYGSIETFRGNNRDLTLRVTMTDRLGREMGHTPGAVVGKGNYDNRSGSFNYRPLLYTPDEKGNAARHCQGIYGMEREYTIRAVAAAGQSEVPGKWEAIPAYDQICEIHAVDVRDCRVKKCTRFVEAEKFLIVASEADAVNIAVIRGQRSGQKTLAESQRELKELDRATQRPATYWEAGGECGARSCYEENIDSVNQFLIDNYW